MEQQENISAERSLQIISESIEQSRRTITRGSWKGMMSWGLICMALALVIGHLWEHTSMGTGANGLWGLLGIVGLVEAYYKKKQPRKPKTFVSKTISQVWGGFGLMAGSLGVACGLMALLGVTPHFVDVPEGLSLTVYVPIVSIIILLMGLAGTITGMILANRVITACCFLAGLVGSIAALFFAGAGQMVVLAAFFALCLVFPALALYYDEKREDNV